MMAEQSAEAIERWLVSAFADYMGMKASEIDPAEHFAQYGGDSIGLVTLLGDLEAELGLKLPHEMIFDHPTFRDFAGEVARHIDGLNPALRSFRSTP